MKVLILCGGIGTRLKEETEFKPKPMVYVGGKPIIWHIMQHFSYFGHNEFILALGYKAEYIKEFFLNQKVITSDFTLDTATHKTKYYLKSRAKIDNFHITFVDTGLESVIGERILKCKEYMGTGNFIVTYGDSVSDVDINSLISFHKKQQTIATITGVHPRSKYGLARVSKDNIVESFKEKPVLTDWVNGGYMVFKQEAFSYFRPNETELTTLQKLIPKKQVSIFKHNGFWFAVDTFKELEDLNKIWDSGNPPWKLWK